jgi:electron transfer flavoprotein alpha/beta subunit
MKVVVCVEPAGVSPAALAALGLALRLGPSATIIALAGGVAPDGKAVLEACQRGATGAAEVTGTGLDGVDAVLMGRALAHAASRLEAQLVLLGARSDGEGRGVVGAAVAHHLRAVYLPHVEGLSLDRAEEGEVVVTLRSAGRMRRLAAVLPAVLTVGPGLPPPAGTPSITPPSIERILWNSAPESPRARRTGIFGTLERPRKKAQTVHSAAELIKRWKAP